MSKVLELLKTRRSIRKFAGTTVSDDLINKVTTAGQFAASGRGKQSAVIVVIKDPAYKEQIRKLNATIMGKDEAFDPFYGAPVYILVAALKEVPTHVYDGTLVLANMMIEAHALGLGSCWIHRAKESMDYPLYQEIFKKLGIEGEYEGIGHLALGYAATAPMEAAPRKEHFVYTL